MYLPSHISRYGLESCDVAVASRHQSCSGHADVPDVRIVDTVTPHLGDGANLANVVRHWMPNFTCPVFAEMLSLCGFVSYLGVGMEMRWKEFQDGSRLALVWMQHVLAVA